MSVIDRTEPLEKAATRAAEIAELKLEIAEKLGHMCGECLVDGHIARLLELLGEYSLPAEIQDWLNAQLDAEVHAQALEGHRALRSEIEMHAEILGWDDLVAKLRQIEVELPVDDLDIDIDADAEVGTAIDGNNAEPILDHDVAQRVTVEPERDAPEVEVAPAVEFEPEFEAESSPEVVAEMSVDRDIESAEETPDDIMRRLDEEFGLIADDLAPIEFDRILDDDIELDELPVMTALEFEDFDGQAAIDEPHELADPEEPAFEEPAFEEPAFEEREVEEREVEERAPEDRGAKPEESPERSTETRTDGNDVPPSDVERSAVTIADSNPAPAPTQPLIPQQRPPRRPDAPRPTPVPSTPRPIEQPLPEYPADVMARYEQLLEPMVVASLPNVVALRSSPETLDVERRRQLVATQNLRPFAAEVQRRRLVLLQLDEEDKRKLHQQGLPALVNLSKNEDDKHKEFRKLVGRPPKEVWVRPKEEGRADEKNEFKKEEAELGCKGCNGKRGCCPSDNTLEVSNDLAQDRAARQQQTPAPMPQVQAAPELELLLNLNTSGLGASSLG